MDQKKVNEKSNAFSGTDIFLKMSFSSRTAMFLLFLAALLSYSILLALLFVLLKLPYGWLIFFGLFIFCFGFLFVIPFYRYPPKDHWLSNKFTYKLVLKRLCDLPAAFIAILMLSPILVVISFLIKLDTRGPALYNCKSIGLYGYLIDILKFRTTFTYSLPLIDKSNSDNRITRVGKFLQRFSLNQFPMFYNVLKGDMSIVGPRPITPEQMKKIHPDQYKRFSFPPGITGLWQISETSTSSWEDMIDLDLTYIDNWSLLSDIKIIIRTVFVVLVS
jgi:lipopolysaccharide/colanic/teichoic acid biosynthesis glycosyltransferase